MYRSFLLIFSQFPGLSSQNLSRLIQAWQGLALPHDFLALVHQRQDELFVALGDLLDWFERSIVLLEMALADADISCNTQRNKVAVDDKGRYYENWRRREILDARHKEVDRASKNFVS